MSSNAFFTQFETHGISIQEPDEVIMTKLFIVYRKKHLLGHFGLIRDVVTVSIDHWSQSSNSQLGQSQTSTTS